MSEAYQTFLKSKVKLAESLGFGVDDTQISQALKPHQRATVKWMVEGGRRAPFLAFGLGKSVIQMEALRLIVERERHRALIVAPLGVRQEFERDAREILGWSEGPRFVRSMREVSDPGEGRGLYLTNYETVRDGKLDPREFVAVSLDEASCLRGFGGTKTFREFMATMAGDDRREMGNRVLSEGIRYRYVATATPSPNDYIELLAYAAFLGVMDVGQAKTRFFKRDSTQADKLTLHPHKEREFWLFVASWALFVQRPSDLGFSDEGYVLPKLEVRWHEVATDHSAAGSDKDGQRRMFRDAMIGVQESAAEKRESLPERLAKLMELRQEYPGAHRVIWHDLEAERAALEGAIGDLVTVKGNDDDDYKERSVLGFAAGSIPEIAVKPCMFGTGVNWQKHCWWAIYFGIGFKFHDFIQSVHRLYRFLQKHDVRIDLIYTEAERSVRQALERKWSQHNELVDQMTKIIREFGLSQAAMAHTLTRSMGVTRKEVQLEGCSLVNNDGVLEAPRLESDSVGLVLTSWPFSTQYEYSPSYHDFGHNDGNEDFFEQMDFLTPEIYRALMPGRIYAVHVKDRIVPSGMTGFGFQTVYPFHLHCIQHCLKHGFGYLGMKTIVTDVVRENAQTYRLGWTEQCKDGSKMGVGMPEYLLLFRKPPTDRSNGYADLPVVKSKEQYGRCRWQFDAHGFMRSSGNRWLAPEELDGLAADQIFKLFKDHSLKRVYDFENDVALGEALASKGLLPPSFMLLQPQSWHEDVWTDITRMRTINERQSAQGKEMHLCPMQFDIADRVIEQMSMPGEIVLDPFGGLFTTAQRALLKRRRAISWELSPAYFGDGVAYCRAICAEMSVPDLFAFIGEEAACG